MWIRHSLEWGVVGAGVTLLTCASNPRPSITILSKVLPPPLWVTIYTIFLHRVHHHLELCSCFFGDCLSPLGEYKCHEGSDTTVLNLQIQVLKYLFLIKGKGKALNFHMRQPPFSFYV